MSRIRSLARILVAEDEQSVRDFVDRALTGAGHAVTSVDDGIKALDALAGDEFDLLLTDIRMPELDGVELALKVSKDQPDLPILMMTGFATEKQRAHNFGALIQGVLQKPFTLEQLGEAIDDVLPAG